MKKQKLVLIGASTGGPGHLKKLLLGLPKELSVPIVIAQHMGELFIPSFIQQFQSELQAPVFPLNATQNLEQGGIYICEHNIKIGTSLPLCAKTSKNEKTLYNPNVDILFSSAVSISKDVDILAILLTGIGHDGASGLAKLNQNGAMTIGESEESAIVFGMPKKAQELIPNLKMLDLDKIKIELERFTNVLF